MEGGEQEQEEEEQQRSSQARKVVLGTGTGCRPSREMALSWLDGLNGEQGPRPNAPPRFSIFSLLSSRVKSNKEEV